MIRYTIKELPALERPYEKLELYGERTLSNAELLAIIIKSGTREETSVQLAQRVLNECCLIDGNFSIKNISINSLMNIKGIGRVKAIVLKAAFELANRINLSTLNKPVLSHSSLAGEYLLGTLGNEKQEKLKVLGLNVKGCLERDETVAIGGINCADVSPSDVFRMPIEVGCCDIIIAHNHPSGDPTPSEADILLTAKLIEVGKLLKINLVDHIIIGDGKYISMRQHKLLNW